MKGYVEQLERLGYVLPRDLSVGLISNGLTSDFAGFFRNYNMHNMGKTIGALHAILIEYEKGLSKKAETPKVMAIRSGKIQKAYKKLLKAKGKGKANGKGNDKQVYIPKHKNPKPSAKQSPAKDETCHHCKEGLRGAKKLEQEALYLYVGNGVRAQVEAIGSFDLVLPNGLLICLDNFHYAPTITRVSKNDVLYFNAIPCDDKLTRKPFSHRTERATDLFGIIHTDVCNPLRHVSRQGDSYFITFTDDYSRYGCVYLLKHKHEVFETFKVFKNEVENQPGKIIKALRLDRGGEYISQEYRDYLKASGNMVRSMMNLPTLPLSFWDYALESATRILNMVLTKKVDKTPYELWIPKGSNGLLFLLPTRKQNCCCKKKTDMDGIVHTYKALLVAKGYTQLYGVDYEETFSSVADIRAIRILIAIAAYYDYEIWQMNVKTAFLNGYLDEDIYMVQPEGGHVLMQEKLDLNKTQGASTPEEVKHMQNVPYASALRSIMYAVRCTRPDVAFAQNITSHFQQNPDEPHWTVVKNILKYLRNKKDMFLVYGGNLEAELRVDCYCGVGFKTAIDNIKSQTGYVFVLNGDAMDWKSSKQSTTATSATAVEYIAASEAAMEAVWIRKFISRLGVQKGARHYHRRYHYVHECIELGEIDLLKVHTDDNLADPFMKVLPKGKITQHARSI
nr:hypothetical protein [Tanacetum cinerariifolium]